MYGVDLDSSHVTLANAALHRFGIAGEARCADAVDPIFPDAYFDTTISSDFFEHITPDVKLGVLRNVYRMLKPGGALHVLPCTAPSSRLFAVDRGVIDGSSTYSRLADGGSSLHRAQADRARPFPGLTAVDPVFARVGGTFE
jgi:ubiquinone/menaquinone biosynthesis C-methylase UbiE